MVSLLVGTNWGQKMKIYNADCLEQLKEFFAESVDSIVTDPPAGISFMGKDWDSNKGGSKEWIAWMTQVMQECLRVLKPGGHALVWSLPRTSHWTATAIEDAGFEVRDVITHLFGSGFPKSHNISKAIDKKFGKEREVIGYKTSPEGREYIKEKATAKGEHYNNEAFKGSGQSEKKLRITAPASDLAKQWDGWGTATKPAVEMWLLVAKPFTTVPIDAIVSEINLILRDYICQQLDAKFVKKISMSNLKDLRTEEKSDFAQWIVEVLNTLKSEDLLEKMDMCKSQEMAKMLLNIASSWKDILIVLLNMENKYITKMESDLITELTILNSLIYQTIQENTTREKTSQNGKLLSAMSVNAFLKSALQKLIVLMETFVQESVSTTTENLQGHRQHMPNYAPEMTKGCLSEHWILCRKPFKGSVVDNVLKHGTGALNIDACRVETCGDDAAKHLKEWDRVQSASNQRDDKNCYGKFSAIDLSSHKPQGRFPSNLLLSHHAECDDTCHDECAVKMLDEDSVGASRFFKRFKYQAKASKKERNEGLEGMEEKESTKNFMVGVEDKGNNVDASIRQYKTPTNQNHHPTIKSIELMKYLITMITPPNGKVLDPFMGSGSTGVAAVRLGFDFIGIEKQKEYFEIAKKRIEKQKQIWDN